jgi:hypothetical protein
VALDALAIKTTPHRPLGWTCNITLFGPIATPLTPRPALWAPDPYLARPGPWIVAHGVVARVCSSCNIILGSASQLSIAGRSLWDISQSLWINLGGDKAPLRTFHSSAACLALLATFVNILHTLYHTSCAYLGHPVFNSACVDSH